MGTGIGPRYQPGGLLYVGKSAGPLGNAVGSGLDQATSFRASTEWMVQRRNKSGFWQMVDQIDPTRTSIAWTNICKMDERGGDKPPRLRHWRTISDVCIDALEQEVRALNPRVILFAASSLYAEVVLPRLRPLGLVPGTLAHNDGHHRYCVQSTAVRQFLQSIRRAGRGIHEMGLSR